LLGVDYGLYGGIYGAKTEASVKAFQTKNGITASGVIGGITSKALLKPIIARAETAAGAPSKVVFGLLYWESGFDLGAVGYATPLDIGLAQINTQYNSPEQAINPIYSINWTAENVAKNFNKYRTQSTDINRVLNATILRHNWPVAADKYILTGVYPAQKAADYVANVKGRIAAY
jgi:peptidoglycan hydrolase-like protein with peptidoglycan-binding domain